jgi:hypothetical protein
VSPAWTRISSSTPSYGLGISESTLSVDTSNSGSSKATVSPTSFSQLPIVPSVTVSPSFGMVMSCTSPVGAATAGSSPAMPSEPPMLGEAGSLSAAPPAAAVSGFATAGASTPACGGWSPLVPPVEPGAPMRTRGVPTGTVSPGPTRISTITPSYGLGISESTLSVETSNSGSSKATVSPTSFSQLPMVPSVTVSPSFGIETTHSSLIAVLLVCQP